MITMDVKIKINKDNVAPMAGLIGASLGLGLVNVLAKTIFGGNKMDLFRNNNSGMSKLLDVLSTIIKEKDDEISQLNDKVAAKEYDIDRLNDTINILKEDVKDILSSTKKKRGPKPKNKRGPKPKLKVGTLKIPA